MSKRSDELSELWNEVCSGNQRAYSLIHQSLYSRLYTYGKRIVKDDELVDDVLQETFIRLWMKKESIGSIENVEGYFYAVMFKRKGIYYYLYTLGGDEKYQYAYGMGKTSPLGPFDFPEKDIISTTNHERQVFGPGHGSVFNVPGTDDYYFAYLEFGRRSTNRQTYVNKLEFNEDGTIRPVDLTLNGVGALHPEDVSYARRIKVVNSKVSSVCSDLIIKPMKDSLFRKTESFSSHFAFDDANGSRWMATPEDTAAWIVADLGKSKNIKRSEVYFVRPTAGHGYVLEYSINGKTWKPCGGHPELVTQSPHTDNLNIKARYLRVKILSGVNGVWEWNIYKK